MASDEEGERWVGFDDLGLKPGVDELRQARQLAISAFEKYCGPTISLAELRAILDWQLKDVSLSELIMEDRELD